VSHEKICLSFQEHLDLLQQWHPEVLSGFLLSPSAAACSPQSPRTHQHRVVPEVGCKKAPGGGFSFSHLHFSKNYHVFKSKKKKKVCSLEKNLEN
jgi:hypothetical protein